MTDKQFQQVLIVITIAAILSVAVVVAEYLLRQ